MNATDFQAYLRASAQKQYQAVAVPPFTAFFHPEDALPYFNYAIPDLPVEGDLRSSLEGLCAEFDRRGRLPRFEFLHEYAPGLSAALREAGWTRQAQQRFLACTPHTFLPAADLPGVRIASLNPQTPPEEIRAYLTVQRRGFEPENQADVTDVEVEQRRTRLHGSWAFLAYLDGAAACAGLLGEPLETGSGWLTEWMGVATLEAYRGRGLAMALTRTAVQAAFDGGVSAVCLTAEDERAGRVYERAGFRPAATALSWIH